MHCKPIRGVSCVSGVAGNRKTLRKALLRRRSDAKSKEQGQNWRPSRLLAVTKIAQRRVCTVAAYLPLRSEADPRPLMSALKSAGFITAVVGPARRGSPLQFYRYPTNVLSHHRGPLGIEVPPPLAEQISPEIIITPCVGITRAGGRLGMGRGFYDRTITRLRRIASSAAISSPANLRSQTKKPPLRKPSPLTIGFARASQFASRLPLSQHDARLDATLMSDFSSPPMLCQSPKRKRRGLSTQPACQGKRVRVCRL